MATFMSLPRGEQEVHGVAVGVSDQVDLRGEPASGSSETLSAGPPCAPAACWCARITVPSRVVYKSVCKSVLRGC